MQSSVHLLKSQHLLGLLLDDLTPLHLGGWDWRPLPRLAEVVVFKVLAKHTQTFAPERLQQLCNCGNYKSTHEIGSQAFVLLLLISSMRNSLWCPVSVSKIVSGWSHSFGLKISLMTNHQVQKRGDKTDTEWGASGLEVNMGAAKSWEPFSQGTQNGCALVSESNF